jgi:hypothetical protein
MFFVQEVAAVVCLEDRQDIVAINLRLPCRDEIATTPQELDVWGRMRDRVSS